jgi:hypothetical protein
LGDYNLTMPTDLPKIAQPAVRALASVNVAKLEHLGSFTEKDIKDLHGMGPKALGKLKEAMSNDGIKFKADAG